MRRIIDHMNSNGFNVNEVVLDGKIHRFKHDASDKKESAWYCGFQNYTRAGGEQFHVVKYGSWKSSDTYQYQSDVKYSPEDHKSIKDQIAKAKKAAEAVRKIEQEKTAAESSKKWDSIPDGGTLTEYLTAKGITALYGARSADDMFGRVLYIPMRDADGKIWSLQKIQDNGQKFFMPGGQVSGCFHVIGGALESSDVTYIAEGFATAASVHMAIGRPVVVAFNAHNIVPVSEALKGKYPDHAFVICGDDDIWSKKPDGTPYNAGRERAEEAAKKTMGVSIFPHFKDLEEGLATDFNDLMQREGIEAVKEQVAAARPEKHYIVPLGYNGSSYYFISNVNSQIQCLNAASMSSSGLCRLQPLAYWESAFPSRIDGVSWQKAADSLMQGCHKKGIFHPDRVRGQGVWHDASRVVYHRGEHLYFDGKDHELHRNDLHSRFIYEKDDLLSAPHSRPLTVEDCSALLDACSLIRWKRQDAAMLFSGWLVVAPVSGAMAWRPHMWLTGASGTGKSYLMQELIHPLLSGFVHFFQGQTTEAGIRQTVRCSTLPVIFDEFETNDDRSSDRIRSILELARQASSESDAVVAKGTVGGDAMQFKPRFSMMVSSVRVNLPNEEDQNRFTILDLERNLSDDRVQQFEKIKTFVARITPEFGHRLFSRTLKMMPVLQKNCEILLGVLGKRHNMRTGQQYGALLAGYFSLTSDSVITQGEAESLCNALELTLSREESASDQDERECLNFLMEKVISTQSGLERVERSIAELIIMNTYSPSTYLDSLQRIGIVVEKDFVCIATKHRAICDFYGKSRWSSNYAKPLSRLPGTQNNKGKWFSLLNKAVKCICIPLSEIIEKR
jgi:putative DNA primase/helicase